MDEQNMTGLPLPPQQPAPQPVAQQPEAQQPAPQQQPVAQQPAAQQQPEAQPNEKPKSKLSGAFDKLKSIDWKNADVKTLFAKDNEEYVSGTAATFEVSLVPEVKVEAIRAIKRRNLTLFICIVIVAVFGGLAGVLGSVVTGQNLTMSNQDARIEAMSDKINSFDGLEEYLTIQDQLGNISTIQENRKVLSRIFSFLNVMLPNGPDTITISELNVNLRENTISFTGQADAGVEPFIDYRVLEAFKKSVAMVKYDYGRYVDAEGEEIPTRCMVESNSSGTVGRMTVRKLRQRESWRWRIWQKKLMRWKKMGRQCRRRKLLRRRKKFMRNIKIRLLKTGMMNGWRQMG